MDHAAVKSPAMPVSLWCLFAAVALYAALGSPTPDNPGIVEGVIGVLLILSVGTSFIHNTANLVLGQSFFLKAMQVFFLCGLILPTLSGVYFGNDRMLMARDLAAFAFLGLPLFLSTRFEGQEKARSLLTWLLVFAGVVFCVRTLLPVFNVWIPQGELLYLSNSPLALFAGVFLAGMLWNNLQNLNRISMFKCIFLLAGLGLVLGAMLLDVQRATVGAVIMTVLFLMVIGLFESPKGVILPVLLLAGLLVFLYPALSEALSAISRKTAEVGLNMRVQEARAVYDALAASVVPLFIGQGWGSVFQSPAVGGLDVNYTHSLLTTMALKGGLLLLLPAMLVVVAALYEICLIFQRDKVLGLSLFWSLVIPVFLYASHKSLDFGLLLLLIGVWSNGAISLHTGDPSCKKKEYLSDKKEFE